MGTRGRRISICRSENSNHRSRRRTKMNGKREERLKSFQRFEKMNKILQIKGLGTLFTVFIISQNRTPRGCTRISIFMLFCYIIAKIQEGQEGGLLSLKDGIYKINNTKVRLIIFIKGLAILI